VPPTRTPRPTPKPTPTPEPIAIDLSTFIYGSDLPNPWYTNTTYTIPIYVEVTGAEVRNVHVKVAIVVEGFSQSFDTGPIAEGDNYSHNVAFNLEAMGPATLTWSVKVPAGYYDTDASNNKGSFDFQVLPKP